MRVVFGVLSLLIVVTVIGVLAKKQLGALSGAGTLTAISGGGASSVVTPQQHSQQLQDQVKKSVDDAMQQARPAIDDQ